MTKPDETIVVAQPRTRFTSREILAIIAGLTALLVSVGGSVSSIIIASKQESAMQQNTQATQEISAKTDVIAGHVNSQATASVAKIEALLEKIAILEAIAADKKEIAALLAQSVSGKEEKETLEAKAPVEVEIVNKHESPVPVTESKPTP